MNRGGNKDNTKFCKSSFLARALVTNLLLVRLGVAGALEFDKDWADEPLESATKLARAETEE